MGAIGFRWLVPILYTVALTMMMWVVYLFYGKWYVVLVTDQQDANRRFCPWSKHL